MVKGYLKLITGPMGSGKTGEVMRILETHSCHTIPVLINSANDSRSDNVISSHSDLLSEAGLQKVKAIKIKVARLSEVDPKIWTNSSIFVIDEAQFFPDLFEMVDYLVNDLGKRVYVAGLMGDFKRNLFGQMHLLIPHMDAFEFIPGVCKVCASTGRFTESVCTAKFSGSSDQIEAGFDQYKGVCRGCFNHHAKESDHLSSSIELRVATTPRETSPDPDESSKEIHTIAIGRESGAWEHQSLTLPALS